MSNRKNHTDIMLLLALAAMAVRGVALPVWSKSAPVNSVWDISGAYSVISAWGFPLLVAATGCRYLANSQSYSTGFVLKKLLPRALLGCAVWWLVSALTLMKYSNKNEIDTDTFFEAMSKALNAPYYARFLQLVVIFFAFYPLLKRIADDKKLTGYAVIVFAVFSAAVPVMKHIPYLSYGYMFLSQLNWGFFTEFGLMAFPRCSLLRGRALYRRHVFAHFLELLTGKGHGQNIYYGGFSVYGHSDRRGDFADFSRRKKVRTEKQRIFP